MNLVTVEGTTVRIVRGPTPENLVNFAKELMALEDSPTFLRRVVIQENTPEGCVVTLEFHKEKWALRFAFQLAQASP